MSEASEEIAALVSRAALGDREAFRTLYARTSGKLFAVSLRILKDRPEAEDALQEVYVRIWRRASSFRPGETSAMSWLIAIARNHAIDRLRARAVPAADIDEAMEVADAAPGPEALAAGASEMARIAACMEELPAARARAVSAAYVDGYSYQELAERFGVPLNTMRTWLHRSLKSLKECLERQKHG